MSQLLSNPNNPSAEELAAALKLVRAGEITHKQTATPDWTATCASASSASSPREVQLAIYDPVGLDKTTPRPVVLNWHGSGFVVPRFGADADCNRWLVEELKNATVVDGDYVKAPEYPFPEALHDVVGAVKWVVAQPWFDGNLVVKGHSAGANFALVLASRTTALSLGLTPDEYACIKASVALYPPTDSTIPVEHKNTNENGEEPGIPMAALSADVIRFFFGCYLGFGEQGQIEKAKDPRVSPACAATESYEVPCYIIACEHDPLGAEAETFAHTLIKHNDKHEYYFAPGVGHGYETRIPDVRAAHVLDVPGGKAKVESYAQMLAFLRKNVPTVQKA